MTVSTQLVTAVKRAGDRDADAVRAFKRGTHHASHQRRSRPGGDWDERSRGARPPQRPDARSRPARGTVARTAASDLRGRRAVQRQLEDCQGVGKARAAADDPHAWRAAPLPRAFGAGAAPPRPRRRRGPLRPRALALRGSQRRLPRRPMSLAARGATAPPCRAPRYSRTGRPAAARPCLTSAIDSWPKWKTLAARTASAPAWHAATKWSMLPAPPLAMTGTSTAWVMAVTSSRS